MQAPRSTPSTNRRTGSCALSMEQSLFGSRFQEAQKLLAGATDPVKLVELTSRVSRAIYESESVIWASFGMPRDFRPRCESWSRSSRRNVTTCRKNACVCSSRPDVARKGLSLDEARRIMWMYTSRDVYRMLRRQGGGRRSGIRTGRADARGRRGGPVRTMSTPLAFTFDGLAFFCRHSR